MNSTLRDLSFDPTWDIDLEYEIYIKSEITNKTYYIDTYVMQVYEGQFTEYDWYEGPFNKAVKKIYNDLAKIIIKDFDSMDILGIFEIYGKCINAKEFGGTAKEAESFFYEKGENSLRLRSILDHVLYKIKLLIRDRHGYNFDYLFMDIDKAYAKIKEFL